MNIGYVTSVTVAEFMVWYTTGELRLLGRRLLPVRLGCDGLPEVDVLTQRQVTELLPHVDLEDEHSVLIVTLSTQLSDSATASQAVGGFKPLLMEVAYVPASAVLSVHPLTRRGADILQSRLQGFDVRLEAPVFQEEITRLWQHWSQRRSLRGATALLEIGVKESQFHPSAEFVRRANEALAIVDEQREPSPSATPFLIQVLCYNRHKPIPEKDVGFFFDLGVVLQRHAQGSPESVPLVDRLREFCQARDRDQSSLADLLSLPETQEMFGATTFKDPDDIDLYSATLFLKWKYRAQRKETLLIEDLLADVRSCSGRVRRSSIEQALWLSGFYWGFNRVAQDYYARFPDRYRFLVRGIAHEAVELPEETLADEREVEGPEEPGMAVVLLTDAAPLMDAATSDELAGQDLAPGPAYDEAAAPEASPEPASIKDEDGGQNGLWQKPQGPAPPSDEPTEREPVAAISGSAGTEETADSSAMVPQSGGKRTEGRSKKATGGRRNPKKNPKKTEPRRQGGRSPGDTQVELLDPDPASGDAPGKD